MQKKDLSVFSRSHPNMTWLRLPKCNKASHYIDIVSFASYLLQGKVITVGNKLIAEGP